MGFQWVFCWGKRQDRNTIVSDYAKGSNSKNQDDGDESPRFTQEMNERIKKS